MHLVRAVYGDVVTRIGERKEHAVAMLVEPMPGRVAGKDVVPRTGEFERSDDRDGEGIFRRPRLGPVEQEAKFDRQRFARGRRIYTVAERRKRRAIAWIEAAELALCDALDVDRALSLVVRERLCAQHFGKASVGVAAAQVELKETVRSLRVSLREEEIVFVESANVRYVAAVANDRNGRVQSHGDDAAARLRGGVESDGDVRAVEGCGDD